jgi:hypothetical protein
MAAPKNVAFPAQGPYPLTTTIENAIAHRNTVDTVSNLRVYAATKIVVSSLNSCREQRLRKGRHLCNAPNMREMPASLRHELRRQKCGSEYFGRACLFRCFCCSWLISNGTNTRRSTTDYRGFVRWEPSNVLAISTAISTHGENTRSQGCRKAGKAQGTACEPLAPKPLRRFKRNREPSAGKRDRESCK